MKKQYFLMAILAFAAMITFTACSEDDDKDDSDEPAEIAVSDYPSYFPGAWEDSYATRYYCTDGSWYAEYNNGNEAEGSWSLSGSELTVNYSSGETYVYTFEYMYEDEYKIVDNEDGDEFTATLESQDGCYYLDMDEYEDNIPGKWRRDYEDSYFNYYLCDDNTFYYQYEESDTYTGPHTWYYNDGELVLEFTYSDWELDIIKMSSDEIYAEDDNSDELFTRISNNGCYEPPVGSAVFYLTTDCGCGPVTVNVDGNEVGEITSYFPEGDVDCGTDGAVTVDLEPGEYSIYAECEGLYWEFTTTITDGGCTQEELSCSKAFAK